MAGRPREGRLTWGWPKRLLRCFRASVQINPNELFGQPSNITVALTQGFPWVAVASSPRFQGSEAQSVTLPPTSPQHHPRLLLTPPLRAFVSPSMFYREVPPEFSLLALLRQFSSIPFFIWPAHTANVSLTQVNL